MQCSLPAPSQPGRLKCFTKAAIAAPALVSQGKKEEEEGDREVNSTAQRQGAPCK